MNPVHTHAVFVRTSFIIILSFKGKYNQSNTATTISNTSLSAFCVTSLTPDSQTTFACNNTFDICKGCIKMLRTVSTLSYSHQNKEKVHIITCPEIIFFLNLIESLHLIINTLTLYYLTYNWYNTFTVHVTGIITIEFLLFIKWQFTTDTQNILHLNHCTHGHVCSWTVAQFWRFRGGSEWFYRHKNALMWEMKKCYLEWVSRGISYTK
jgi:hypothetical protein